MSNADPVVERFLKHNPFEDPIPREDEEELDVVSWIKLEMMKELDKAMLQEVWGPAVYGEDGFEMFQDTHGYWFIRQKKE